MAKILVVDDEPTLLTLIAAALRKDGHNVTAIGNPLEVVDQVQGNLSDFTLIVTDVDMKPITGFEVVSRLTDVGWFGAVLFMSGHSSKSGVIVESLGQRAVIEKPFTADELRSAVALALSSANYKRKNSRQPAR